MSAKKDALPPWDVQEVALRVRTQRYVLEDRQRAFVGPVDDLRKSVDRDTATRAALVSSIGIVVKAGGDASALSIQVREIDTRLGPDRDRLAALEKEWAIVNEAHKWADYADTGLHWLVFAQAELEKHDRTGVWAPDYHLRKRAD